MQKAGSTKVGLPGFLVPGHRWPWAPRFPQQPPAAATDAFHSSDCWMTAPSLVGLEQASQTGYWRWRSGGGRVWERGGQHWADAPGNQRCPLQQQELHSSSNSRRCRSHSRHSSARAKLAARCRGEQRGGGALLSRAEPSRARIPAAAASQMPSQQQRAR